LRGDDGFEDREGHQAPFTLRIAENSQRSTPMNREQASDGRHQIFGARSAFWSAAA